MTTAGTPAPGSTAQGGGAWIPPLWLSLAILTAVSLVTAGLMTPLVERAYGAEAPALRDMVRNGLWIVGASAPLLGLVKGAVLAAIAWSVLVLGGGDAPFRRLLGVTVCGELVLGAQGVVIAILLWLRIGGGVASVADLRLPTGLDLLFPDPTTAVGAVAAMVTPFHLVWVAFLAWAFVSVAKTRTALGVAAALACWAPAPAILLARAMWS